MGGGQPPGLSTLHWFAISYFLLKLGGKRVLRNVFVQSYIYQGCNCAVLRDRSGITRNISDKKCFFSLFFLSHLKVEERKLHLPLAHNPRHSTHLYRSSIRVKVVDTVRKYFGFQVSRNENAEKMDGEKKIYHTVTARLELTHTWGTLMHIF